MRGHARSPQAQPPDHPALPRAPQVHTAGVAQAMLPGGADPAQRRLELTAAGDHAPGDHSSGWCFYSCTAPYISLVISYRKYAGGVW
jgi:hypothetical protein